MSQINKAYYIYFKGQSFFKRLLFLSPSFFALLSKIFGLKLFENTAVAFRLKTDAELERAYFLFRLISNEPLVKIGNLLAKFAIKSLLPIEGLIRATVFDHFCGGTSAEASLSVVDRLAKQNVFSVLDYSVEGAKAEISLDDCYAKILSTIEISSQHTTIPFTVFKPTGFGAFELYQKVSEEKDLTPDEKAAWDRVRHRFIGCCEAAKKHKMKLLIDAEESWIQPAINQIVEEMMELYNAKEPIVFTTAQMYLSHKLNYLQSLLQKAKEKGFIAGVKLVRGAYMEKENDRALSRNQSSPICASKVKTDENFDNGWQFILDNLSHFALYFGSHNEESAYGIIEAMKLRGLDKKHSRIWFGQLYGMSDHISFNLAEEGYQVSKYLPFGPVRDVLPYLIRRAEENTSVGGQSVRELSLIIEERKRRKINR